MSPVSITNFTVCRTCAGLNGYPPVRPQYPQVCRCHREGQERWPDHDFDEYVDLCWCCGIERIPSGSRFSPFFCPVCLELAHDFNRSMGRVVLFVGRHSLMNGVWMRGDEAAGDEEAEGFGEALVGFIRGLTEFREAVDAWRPHRLHQVLRALGWEAPEDEDPPEVSLPEYLRATRDLVGHPGLGKRAAFKEMVKFLRDRPAEEGR